MEDADNVQLVQLLKDAATSDLNLRQKNAKLQETITELKKEIKLLRSQSTTNTSVRSELERLREQEKTWQTANTDLQSKYKSVVEENSRLFYLKEQNDRLHLDLGQYKETQQTLNQTILAKEKEIIECKTRITHLETTVNQTKSRQQPCGPNIMVKTLYQSDARNWIPSTNKPYTELLEFINSQYDPLIIGYKDLDHDLVRINSDESCQRAFDVAQNNGWNTLRIFVESKEEKKLNQQIVELQLREKRLHKKLHKWKKNQTVNGMKMKKGAILLDQIMNNRKKDDMIGGY